MAGYTPIKLFLSQSVMSALLPIAFTLCSSLAHSQENTYSLPAVETGTSASSEETLLTQIESSKSLDTDKRIQLTNDLLLLSVKNNNDSVSAQAHYLLGELALDQKDFVQSMENFLDAYFIYKNIKDERYKIAEKSINELISLIQQDDSAYSLALILIERADSDYNNKNYDTANVQYFHAVKLLTDSDKQIQKKLGETYKKIAQSYKRLKDREQTAYFYKQALSVFTAIDDRKNMARILNTLAEAERNLDNYLVALDYSTQSLEIHEKIDDAEGQAKALNNAGIIYRYIGRYEKSLEHIYQAYLYYKQIDDVSGIGKTSNQMGLLYTRLKQFDQARSFYQETIDLPEEEIDLNTRASALREIAVIDLNAENYDSAMTMILEAEKIYQATNNKPYLSLASRIIGNIYRDKKDVYNAIIHYRKSLAIATDVGSKLYQIKAQLPLGKALIDSDADEAASLLEQALALSIEINNESHELYSYNELRKLEKYRGNIAESLIYAEKEIKLTETLQKERDSSELALVKAKLYSHTMEMELASLKEKAKLDQLELAKQSNEIEIASQASEIAQLELTKNRYASFALACSLVICLLVIFFIYGRFIHSRKRNKELDYLAARDPLTNCYNRRILYDLLNRDFANLDVSSEYCIIMLDMDHFKTINDTYGHIVGDNVLCGVANILQMNVRNNDTVTRFGGEEFCIVLPDTSHYEGMAVAETIRKKIEASNFSDVTLTCSFGVTSIKFNAKSPSELINQADEALYKSKAAGRNLVTLWSLEGED